MEVGEAGGEGGGLAVNCCGKSVSSHRYDQTFRFREFLLVAVESEELPDAQFDGCGDVQDVHGAVSAGIGVKFAEALGSQMDLRPRCGDSDDLSADQSSSPPAFWFLRLLDSLWKHHGGAT